MEVIHNTMFVNVDLLNMKKKIPLTEALKLSYSYTFHFSLSLFSKEAKCRTPLW